MKGPKPRPVAERLSEGTVLAPNGCMEWTRGTTPAGYGQIGVGSSLDGSRRSEAAHRVAWELANGPIPAGIYVCHSCDNRLCCNVEHLFLGTHVDNMRDMTDKGRQNLGERNGNARLTAKKVAHIRLMERFGLLDYASAAAEYGITRKHLVAVAHGLGWKHVTDNAPTSQETSA